VVSADILGLGFNWIAFLYAAAASVKLAVAFSLSGGLSLSAGVAEGEIGVGKIGPDDLAGWISGP